MATRNSPDRGDAMAIVGRVSESSVEPLGTAIAVPGHRWLTPLHVTGGRDTNLVVVPGPKNAQNGYQRIDPSFEYVAATISVADPRFDMCLLQTGRFCEAFFKGFGSTDDVAPGSAVMVLGYPQVNWGRRVLTEQPASVGARILVNNGPIETKQAVINMQSGPGQSGSPVFSTRGQVVAVLLGSYSGSSSPGILMNGIDTRTFHTSTHAISAEYVREML